MKPKQVRISDETYKKLSEIFAITGNDFKKTVDELVAKEHRRIKGGK